jgi:cyclase
VETLSSRRDFFGTVLAGAAGVTLYGTAFAQQAPVAIKATKLADNLNMITGAGANVIVVAAPDGLLMVDGGLPDRSGELLKTIAEQFEQRPVRALFNTHWHLDHTGSNEALGKAGAKIIAHRNTKRWLSSTVFVEAQNRTYSPRPPEAIPTEIFDTTGSLTFGQEKLEYGHLPPGHTDGDMYVFFPGPNILIVSDALAVARYPVMDYSTGGWIGGMIDSTAALIKLSDAQTRVVPGAGALQTRNDLQAEHDMLVTVKERVQTMLRQGKGLADVMPEMPTKEFDAKWGKPDLFLSMTYAGLLRHTHEIGGIL